MTRSIAIMIAALIVAAISAAQAQEVKHMVGPLEFFCGKWVNTAKNTPRHEVLKTWIFGYLSGINVAMADPDFLKGRDVDGITAWVDNYCRRNPLHQITIAIDRLIEELRAKR